MVATVVKSGLAVAAGRFALRGIWVCALLPDEVLLY